MEILKQNVGVDIAKDTFVATFAVLIQGQEINNKKSRSFKNTVEGIQEFTQWIDELKNSSLDIHITMEATGVYYETLAYSLYGLENIVVHVLLPNIAKKYFESLNTKVKTDKIDSKLLGQMGLERKMKPWVLSSKIYRNLRTLTREKEQLIQERTMIKNQLHAEKHTAEPFKRTITRYTQRIKYLDKQINSVQQDLKKMVEKDNHVARKVKNIETIPGVSFSTIVGVIAETGGFVNVKSLKQLTSYSGYDVTTKESGEWKGKASISKKGNSHIRHLMHMPALSSIRHAETYKKTYERIKENKEYKMIAVVAIQRKILGLIYTLWKNDTTYIENYENSKIIMDNSLEDLK